jgi:hypothetical protein
MEKQDINLRAAQRLHCHETDAKGNLPLCSAKRTNQYFYTNHTSNIKQTAKNTNQENTLITGSLSH